MIARLLEWDTEFWGFRVGQGERAEDNRWADLNVDVMTLLVPASDTDEVKRIEVVNSLDEAAYRLVDVRVTLTRGVEALETKVRVHNDTDIETLAAVARTAHRDSRFYADPSFPDDRCDDLYETWLRNSCAGYAARVLVAGPLHNPTGYCTVHLSGTAASIGLIAVSEYARRWGRGKELVIAAIDEAWRQRCDEISVVTQGRNIEAQRLFQAYGFRTTATSLWFHKDFR